MTVRVCEIADIECSKGCGFGPCKREVDHKAVRPYSHYHNPARLAAWKAASEEVESLVAPVGDEWCAEHERLLNLYSLDFGDWIGAKCAGDRSVNIEAHKQAANKSRDALLSHARQRVQPAPEQPKQPQSNAHLAAPLGEGADGGEGREAWRPIETAPKNGTPVLVGNMERGGPWIAKYEPVYQSGYRPPNPWFGLMLNCDWHKTRYASYEPTHWMPLPAAPSASIAPAKDAECATGCVRARGADVPDGSRPA